MEATDGHQRHIVLLRIQGTLPGLQVAAALRVLAIGDTRSRSQRGRAYVGLGPELRYRWEMNSTQELAQYTFPGPRLRPAGSMEDKLASLGFQTPALHYLCRLGDLGCAVPCYSHLCL